MSRKAPRDTPQREPTPAERIAATLETTNAAEQADRVTMLATRVAHPPVQIVVTYDPITGQVQFQPIGVNLSTQQLAGILGAAQVQIGRMEAQAQIEQEAREQAERNAAIKNAATGTTERLPTIPEETA